MRKSLAAIATVMLVLPVLGGATPASATDTGTVTQVTNGNNKSTVPVITGAGDKIVYHTLATDINGTAGLVGIENVLVNTVGGAHQQIVIDGLFPDISANGRWVAFTRPVDAQPDEVVRYDNQTGASAVVASGNANSGSDGNLAGVSVDNDGNVVFQSLATNLLFPAGDTDDSGGWDVYRWNGSSTIRLSDDSQTHFKFPDTSANGATIVYNSVSSDGTDRTLYRNTVAGTAQTPIANGNGRDEHGKVNDDGTKVVFRSDSTNLVGGSFSTVNAYVWSSGSSGGIVRVTNNNDAGAVTNPSISGNGEFIAYQRGSQIYRSKAVTNGATIQLSAHTGSGLLINYPSVNNDGSKVAYAQSTDDTVAGVEILLWNVVTYCAFNNPVLNTGYQAKRGTDGLIARLYAAYYQRNPDAGGYLFWQQQIAAGRWTNDHAASFFGESPEFVALYGASLTNAQFVDRLYANVMCRDAAAFDPGGRAYWIDRMNNGDTRGTIALFFSDSAEFRGRVQHPLQG